METNLPTDQKMLAAVETIKARYPHIHQDGVELWLGDHGKWMLNVPDDDQRCIEYFEWNDPEWIHVDFEMYHD